MCEPVNTASPQDHPAPRRPQRRSASKIRDRLLGIGHRQRRHMKVPDGYPLVKGRFVTGFANSGEAAIELMQVVPFLVEDMLKRTAASI